MALACGAEPALLRGIFLPGNLGLIPSRVLMPASSWSLLGAPATRRGFLLGAGVPLFCKQWPDRDPEGCQTSFRPHCGIACPVGFAALARG